MQDSLNRSLNAAPNKALPGVKAPQGKGEGNDDKKGKKDRSQTPGPKDGNGGRDSSKGGAGDRSPSAGGGRGKSLDPGIFLPSSVERAPAEMHVVTPTRRNVGGIALRIRAERARSSAPSTPLAPVNSVPTAVTSTVAAAAAAATAVLLPAVIRKGKERGRARRTRSQLQRPPLSLS